MTQRTITELETLHLDAIVEHPNDHKAIGHCHCSIAFAWREAKARRLQLLTDPPLVAGGQGRSAEEVTETATSATAMACVTILSLAIWALVLWACGVFN